VASTAAYTSLEFLKNDAMATRLWPFPLFNKALVNQTQPWRPSRRRFSRRFWQSHRWLRLIQQREQLGKRMCQDNNNVSATIIDEFVNAGGFYD